MNRLQRMNRRAGAFNDRFPLIGPTFWMVCVQYYITQIVVAQWWPIPYSLKTNAISDLGNTACGMYSGRYVCSPGYAWMNASFIVLGATIIAGSWLIYQEFRKSRTSALAFGLMSLGGIGTILVGLFPENVNPTLHFSGALLPILLGNIALLLFVASLDMSKNFRIYTVLSGGIALIALVLFYTKNYLGLGFGGMERLVAYPQTIWLIAFGLYMSRTHQKPQAH
jgi:hypothetical membrane protein